MIEMKNLVVNYPDFRLDCSLSVPDGQITGIVGENGAGKTTAFKALLGLIPVDAGSCSLGGVASNQLTGADRAKTGAVLGPFFNEIYTVTEIAAMLAAFYPSFDKAGFLSRCEHFKLPLKKKIKDFSTGMKAKLKTLSVLSHGATTLILDEPTSGLDVSARHAIIDMLQDYLDVHPEAAILISSHITTDLEKVCDDLYFIKDGSIRLHEDTDVLLDTYGIIKVSEAQMADLDPQYLLFRQRTPYGFDIVTGQRDFYLENYPGLAVEKPSIDDILLIMMTGETL